MRNSQIKIHIQLTLKIIFGHIEIAVSNYLNLNWIAVFMQSIINFRSIEKQT